MAVILIGSLLLFEFVIGYTDYMDLLSIGLGVLAAESVWYGLSHLGSVETYRLSLRPRGLLLISVVAVSGLVATASGPYGGGYSYECASYSEQGNCEEYKRAGTPLYMSYQSLRAAVEIQVARPPDRIGRVYLYGQYIFLNEFNEGIHVLDNSDPEAPINKGFIRIPGNTDIAIKGNYLYADSYIDLITLDLTDPNNVQVVNRQEDIFPYDAFQNIPYNISLTASQTDRRHGVVVGYSLPES